MQNYKHVAQGIQLSLDFVATVTIRRNQSNMAKLQDMFTHARRAQTGSGIGFLGKNKSEAKPRAAAIILELTNLATGNAEAAAKAGVDGLLFNWDGSNTASFSTLKDEIASTKSSNENIINGLRITGGWEKIDRDLLNQIKELGVHYIILPLDAPARLLALETKDLEKALTIPMRSGDMYPIFIRNISSFEEISAVLLDFGFSHAISTMSIEEVLLYRAVREAVRFPALLNVQPEADKADIYTLMALGIQGMILTAESVNEETKQAVAHLRTILEAIHEEDKEATSRKM